MAIFFSALNAQPEDCEIPGKTIQWIAGYCMFEVETEDLLDEKVQICLKENRSYTVVDTCENKKQYKMKICRLLAARGDYNGNAEICFNDIELIPATVRNNITDQKENQDVDKQKRLSGYLSQPYHFLLFFLLFWCCVSLLISFLSGWRSLSGFYRANFPFDGRKLRMKSAGMRWGTNYSACLTIGVNREGLFLAVIPFFRIGHPPLFIPWDDISSEDRKKLFFFRTVKFIFRKCPGIHMVFSKKLAERIFSMSSDDHQQAGRG